MTKKIKYLIISVLLFCIGSIFFAEAFIEDSNPVPFETRTENLNFIFDNTELATITIRITREEWNKQLEYFDINSQNETCVHADMLFEKGDYSWTLLDCGIRLRGNTSRLRPQAKVSKNKNGDYQQPHFKVDFEEWLADDEDRKMAGAMGGIILKRFKDDATYVREVYGYDLFRKNGIWVSPRVSYTRLIFQIVENSGKKKEKITTVDYGIYAMIEEINKQFLKERTQAEKGGNFTSNGGNLWKCTWAKKGASLENNAYDWQFGVEKVYLNEEESQRFDYDLKTNKDKLDKARTEFQQFMNDLSNLKVNSAENIANSKSWIEQRMDVDLFLKTYAVNVILGMWDDYWVNKNNYYLYFEKNFGNGGKVYFIPYDYDNILGVSIMDIDAGKSNPLEWGELKQNGSRPLIQKILLIPEYMDIYKKYLNELSNETSFFSFQNSFERITNWQNMVKPYIDCDTNEKGSFKKINDVPADWGSTPYYRLLSGDEKTNYFKAKRSAIEAVLAN